MADNACGSRNRGRLHGRLGALAAIGMALAACTPTVRLETARPIEIDLNVHINQDVRVRVDRDGDRAGHDNPAAFGAARAHEQ